MPIPVTNKRSGVRYGSSDADIQIEVFIDIQCPHSKLAWPQIQYLLSEVVGENVAVTLHLISLSNHRQSWDISKAIFIYANGDAKRFLTLIDYLYQRQDSFYNAAFREQTHQDLYDFIAKVTFDCSEENGHPFDVTTCLQQLDSDEIYHLARTPNRYAAAKGVWGTPRFFLNDAELLDIKVNQTISDNKAIEQWKLLLSSLN